MNKIDLPQADPDRAAAEVADLLIGDDAANVVRISAKTGQGVAVLDAIVERIPAPAGSRTDRRVRSSSTPPTTSTAASSPSSASSTDASRPATLRAMAQGTRFEAEELGFLSPERGR